MYIKNRIANNLEREYSGLGRPDGRAESASWQFSRAEKPKGKFASMPSLVLKMGFYDT